MLTIVLNILSIIGLILLILLGLILLLLFIVLFVPITYRIKARKYDDIEAVVRVNWLFGLLRARFLYPEPGNIVVKCLFFTIYNSKREKRPPKFKSGRNTKAGDEGDKEKEAPPAETVSPGTSASEIPKGSVPDGEASADGKKESLRSPIEKIKYTFRDFYGKIKDIKENAAYYKEILSSEDTRFLLKHVFTRLGKILKSIRPRKINADIRYGTGSPDTTGYLFGIYGMFCSCLGKHVIVTPDFEQAVLEGKLYAAGHITIFKILWHGLMLAIDKKLWDFISRIKKSS